MQINTNFVSWNYSSKTVKSSTTNVNKPLETTFSKCISKTNQLSVTDEYKKKHPSEASDVDSQINAGKRVLSRNGEDNTSRESMSMDEYKKFFTEMMDSISFDPSRKNDVETWNISEKGWEQMKNDPDYEAWVLGYTVQNRSVRNPFAGMPGSSSFFSEQFGASIEEHVGQGIPMGSSGNKTSSTSKDEKSWWEKRHEEMQKLLKEQMQQAQKNAIANRKTQQVQMFQEQILTTNAEII
jgi:hypothetical protein